MQKGIRKNLWPKFFPNTPVLRHFVCPCNSNGVTKLRIVKIQDLAATKDGFWGKDFLKRVRISCQQAPAATLA
jgi:hypothetical protein